MTIQNAIIDSGFVGEDMKLIGLLAFEVQDYQQIISTISHELRTPVSILKSNIQILKSFSFNIDEVLKDESIVMCEESVENMIRFLDNIRSLNSFIHSGIHPGYSSFNIKQIVYRLFVELAKMNLNYSRITVQWELEVQKITSDLLFLRQILYNLLSNALKYSDDEVNLIITANRKQLIITVKDRGIGIPEKEIELVFNPFHRAANVKKISGAGLGLAMVNILTDSLGGQIYLSSTINMGTTMQIIIPYEFTNENSGH